MFNFIKLGKIGLVEAVISVVAVTTLWFAWGLNLGIDFTGGSLLEIDFSASSADRPDAQTIKTKLEDLGIGNSLIQPLGEKGMMLRFNSVDEETHQKILNGLTEIAKDNQLVERRFESIGPTIGAELSRNAFYTIALVLIAICLYIAWAFRKISKPVASWKYSLAALLALFHDVLIVVGLFIVLGKFMNAAVDTAFVAAVLTVLGYSVNDTVVIFDRIRENLAKRSGTLTEIVNFSINETLVRSLNTGFSAILALLAIFFFGGESIRYFALALIVGIVTGTYSSIFIASPLLLIWEKMKRR
ncbi:MAG: protein translocase subunit SecF [bacterium]